MMKAADEFAMEDATMKKKVEAINALSSYVYSVKSQFTDLDGWSTKVSFGLATVLP
jgi:endoplasmic reticulum chaperone BiP